MPMHRRLADAKVKEAPSSLRRGARWSGSEGGPLTLAAAALVVPKWERPARPCGGGLDGPHAGAAPSPIWRGPRRSESQGGPLAPADYSEAGFR